ncbi:uncharacterized protein LOC120892381 [Ictidomys tridecemlineatus]
MGILKIRKRTGVKKLSLPGWQISCILNHNKGRFLVTSSYPERAEDGLSGPKNKTTRGSRSLSPAAQTRASCRESRTASGLPGSSPGHARSAVAGFSRAEPPVWRPGKHRPRNSPSSRQKDRLGLPERCGCSGRRCRWCSWLPASSPSCVWIRLTTSLLATRPGSAGSRGRRRNRLQRLETQEAPPAEHAPAQCLSRASVGGCEGSSRFGRSRHAKRGGAKRGDVVPVGKGGAEDYEGSWLGAVKHPGHPRKRKEKSQYSRGLDNSPTTTHAQAHIDAMHIHSSYITIFSSSNQKRLLEFLDHNSNLGERSQRAHLGLFQVQLTTARGEYV